jgi:hypothetical protein
MAVTPNGYDADRFDADDDLGGWNESELDEGDSAESDGFEASAGFGDDPVDELVDNDPLHDDLLSHSPVETEGLTGWSPAPQFDLEIVDLEVADEDDGISDASRGSMAGTVASVIVHVWLLMNLAQMNVEEEPHYYDPPIDSHIVTEEDDKPEELEVVKYELANPNDRELEVREVVNAASVGLSQTMTPKVENAPRPLDELIPEARELNVYDIPEGVEVDERVVVKGTNGQAMIQLESALDRVTWEVANNLQEKRVLLVWLLDASGSLKKQKQIIGTRLRRIYGELDALENSEQIPRREIPLLTGVVAFGSKTEFLTPNPTEDFETILNAVQNAPIDPSGRENIFTAVKHVVSTWSRFRVQQHRRIMVVAVTDESGDDFSESLEPAVALCQRHGAKAYVIGPAAVFGRQKGFVPYVAPEDGQTYNLPINLGPETAVIENVSIPFWYSGQQYTYLSSGFAPYALARLVHETGGVYFMSNMTTMSGLTPLGVFDDVSLKPFIPDYGYSSLDDYARDIRKRPIREAIVRASFLSREYKAGGTPTLDLRVTPQNFRQSASNAQRSVARSQLMLDRVLQAFPDGIEDALGGEESERWRMNFCLSYGRLLAQRVRCLEYNFAFAWMKTNLSNQDVQTKSNHWIVKPSSKINYAGNMKKVAEKAEALLKRVVDEAPGTPWAVMAARELKDGMGITIAQRFIPPPPPRRNNNNANNKKRRAILLAAEQKKAAPKVAPKPKPKPKLPNY